MGINFWVGVVVAGIVDLYGWVVIRHEWLSLMSWAIAGGLWFIIAPLISIGMQSLPEPGEKLNDYGKRSRPSDEFVFTLGWALLSAFLSFWIGGALTALL
jgi:hypothetical protein